MSLNSRREYLSTMQQRYHLTSTRSEKSQIISEVASVLNYNRKYVIQALNKPSCDVRQPAKRIKTPKYKQALPAMQLIWEALDFPCAERLQPVLLSTAELLAEHGELVLTPEICRQLSSISRATLARRLTLWRSPKCRYALPRPKNGFRLRSEIPVDRYRWDEDRPGAIEVDLVEHNGGSSLGHFAYTLTVVDIVSGFSRRRAVLGRSQTVVFGALSSIIGEWPYNPWGIHSDNGSEFLSGQLLLFCKQHHLSFTRSRPYHKNDNAHAEQKNRQFVREIVGYQRFDTPAALTWLNEVYACLDVYANLFLPMRKLLLKQREGSRVHKEYDVARTPFQRLLDKDALDPAMIAHFNFLLHSTNPLELHRQLEKLLATGLTQVDCQQIDEYTLCSLG